MKRLANKLFIIVFVLWTFTGCKSDDSGDNVNDPMAENKKGLGTSAEDILSDDIYSSLTVEFVYPSTYRPTETAIDNFRNFILARTSKPNGVNFIETTIESQPGAPYSIEEIRAIEEDVRTQYTEGDNLALYIFFSDGRSTNDSDTTVTLGTAYQNTSIVIYEETLRIVTASNPSLLPILESTTLNHEFGHILGLVNIVNDDIHTEHEDLEHPKHCFVEDCLMYFDATDVGRSTLQRMMKLGGVPELDPLCIADLQAKGGM